MKNQLLMTGNPTFAKLLNALQEENQVTAQFQIINVMSIIYYNNLWRNEKDYAVPDDSKFIKELQLSLKFVF